MIRSRTLGVVGLLALVQACGGATPPPPVVKPPPVATTPPPPPPTRARWVFDAQEPDFTVKLDLGAEGVLYASDSGRRALAKAGGAPEDAQSLALEGIVGMVRDDKGQFGFVASDGDVFVSRGPLGALDVTHPGPFSKDKGQVTLASTTAGKGAILGIATDDHRVLRSSDMGVTWSAVAYAGATKPYGHAIAVQLDGKGNGLLVHVPQRVFVTHDDGATWTPIASPGIGARQLDVDGSGRIFLTGYNDQRAVLDGNALTVTTDEPAPVYTPPPGPDAPREDDRVDRTVVKLAGDHVIELQTRRSKRGKKASEVRVLDGKLGEKRVKTSTSAELLGRDGLSQHVAARDHAMAYLREDADADENAPTSTLFLSNDLGVTWTKDVTFEGSEPQAGSVDVTLGPKGWAFVASLCANGEQYGGGDDDEAPGGGAQNCGAKKVRPAGATAFEDMAFTEDFVPRSFAFDEAHDKVYAIGAHDGDQRLYVSSLAQNKFVATKLDLSKQRGVDAISVDAKGAVRVFGSSFEGAVVARLDPDGKMATEYLPFRTDDVSFSGARGVLNGHGESYETADGGATWVRVGMSGGGIDACSDSGCIAGSNARIGWDLPAVMQGAKVVAAAADAPTKSDVHERPDPNELPAPPKTELACTVSGKPATIAEWPEFDFADNRADVRWASTREADTGAVTATLANKTGVREVSLLGPTPKAAGMEHRGGTRALREGFVAARYSFKPKSATGTYNPVDIELAWVSLVTGKVNRHTVSKHAAFRVARYGITGDAQLVDGGLLFQASDGEPASFFHDDGKVESLSIPSGMSVRDAMRVGGRWLLHDSELGTSHVAISDDQGKTWKDKTWSLDDGPTQIDLALLGGKPTLAITGGGPLAFFGLEAMGDDPPAPTVVDTSSVTSTCDATPAVRASALLPDSQATFTAKIAGGALLTANGRVTHSLATGKSCTAAYQLVNDDEAAFLYADAGSWTGWHVRRETQKPQKQGGEARETIKVEPITCK